MCGITGIFSKNKIDLSSDIIHQMTDAISHRGPDASGYYKSENCFLGHRRLSILDTSSGANQPFHSKCGRFVMVYNGEVYNYKELAQKHNINTKTTSDTEVILELFAKLNTKFVNEINGMFSICIYDTLENKIYLFRDRVGIKPLFYYLADEKIFFSSELKSLKKIFFTSELKSLKKILTHKLSINNSAIKNFLYLGYIPQEETIYNEIKKMPAGSFASFNGNKLKFSNYWNIDSKIEKETIKDYSIAKDKLSNLLTSSVTYRMISDVPFGTFLSGGTDSTLVTALAQSISDKPIKTFSIGFKESKYNESEHAKSVAKYLKTDHHEFILSENDAIEQVANLLDIYDEPFADSSAIPTLLVSQMARKEVKVALSGDGGDELFMGYGMYEWANRLSNPIIKTCRKPISKILNFGGNREKRAAKVFDYPSEKRLKSHIFSQEQYLFSESELNTLLVNNSELIFNEESRDLNRTLTARESQTLFDFNNYLKDDLLVKVDRASMHHSLEVRVPLLDHRIAEFAFNLDEKLKVNDGIQKYLLKEVLYDYVPKQIMDRPKWGFGIPLVSWLSKDLKYLIVNYLSKESIENCNIVKYEIVHGLKKSYLNGETHLYNRIWVLILLHKWILEND